MPQLQAVEKLEPLFPYWKWDGELSGLEKQYCENLLSRTLYSPTSHSQIAHAMEREFPHPTTDPWTQYKHQNENKSGMNKAMLFPRTMGEVTDVLNSPQFVEWLSVGPGIPNLIADPGLEGGGLHQSSRGGFLNVHTDFSMHHDHKNWRRRVNLILYLNEGWQESWGGAIELWDNKCNIIAKYPPMFNQALNFNTDEKSFHGFPERLTCPRSRFRKSLAVLLHR